MAYADACYGNFTPLPGCGGACGGKMKKVISRRRDEPCRNPLHTRADKQLMKSYATV